MVKFILQRSLKALVTLFFVVTAVFFLTRLSGNPITREFQDEGISDEIRKEIEAYYGLDKPILEQYWNYISGLFKGYAGRSISKGSLEVTEMYWRAFKMTAKLVVWCIFIGPVFGIPLGILAAVKRNRVLGQGVMLVTALGYAFPSFVVAIGLILIFSFKLGWFPSMGDATMAHFFLPIITLSIGSIASITRYTRNSMLDVLSEDYIRTARGKGLSEKIVIFKHALRNGLIPVVTLFGTELADLFNGSLIVETIFAWPGFGYMLITAVKSRDYPVVQFGVLITAVMIITANLMVDILYGVVDPRIRTEG